MYTINDLLAIMEKLRSPKGCPWDREQTHQTLGRYLVEESYEVLEAINQHNPQLLADELGDILLQVVFHAQIAAEAKTFDMNDIVRAICEKLIRRHPHVFADTEVESVADVLRNWEEIKKSEKLNQDRQSLLDGIPAHLPALLRAEKAQMKTAKIGFEWDSITGAYTKLEEELHELGEAIKLGETKHVEEEFGDVLFSLVNIARYLNVNPEMSLNATTNTFIQRFQYMEKAASAQNLDLSVLSLAEMDVLWDQAKIHFRKNPQV